MSKPRIDAAADNLHRAVYRLTEQAHTIIRRHAPTSAQCSIYLDTENVRYPDSPGLHIIDTNSYREWILETTVDGWFASSFGEHPASEEGTLRDALIFVAQRLKP